jgi:hypothetical protein
MMPTNRASRLFGAASAATATGVLDIRDVPGTIGLERGAEGRPDSTALHYEFRGEQVSGNGTASHGHSAR